MRDEDLKKKLGLEASTPWQSASSEPRPKPKQYVPNIAPKLPREEIALEHPLAHTTQPEQFEVQNIPAQDQTTPPPPATEQEPQVETQPVLSKKELSFKKPILIASATFVFAALSFGAVLLVRSKHTVETPKLVSGTTAAEVKPVTIALYYPKNLPSGFTYNNDGKVLNPDVYYYSVTGPNNKKFYVTQQPIPANFDFKAFNKKFLNPDTFTANVGSVTAGAVGANMIGSVQTNKNTWIIVNTDATLPLVQLESVIRSLSESK